MVLLVVPPTLQTSGCSLPPGGIQTGRVAAGLGDALVEALAPFDRSSLKLVWSGGSVVVGVDTVGCPPHGDFTDEGDDGSGSWPFPAAWFEFDLAMTASVVGRG